MYKAVRLPVVMVVAMWFKKKSKRGIMTFLLLEKNKKDEDGKDIHTELRVFCAMIETPCKHQSGSL